MEFLTNDKLTIVGAAGMIGSNMAQTALMMRLTPNICLCDPYAPALEGVAEELYHCAFEGVNITWTSDIREGSYGRFVCRFVGRRGAQGGHDARRPAERQYRDRRAAGQGHQDLLPRCEACGRGFQSRRHHGTGDADLCGHPSLAAFDPRRAGQHAPAFGAGQVFQDFARRNPQLPHLRRPRRADGRLRLDDARRRTSPFGADRP